MALTDASGASLVLVPCCRLVMLSKVRRKHDHESKKFEFEELTALVVGSAFCAWQGTNAFSGRNDTSLPPQHVSLLHLHLRLLISTY